MRIVSLTCSNTEIVHALGCADRLVGVDADSDWPEDTVRDLPRVGRDLDIDVEAVAALKPDLVLASLTVPGHENVVANLDAAGLPFLAPEPISLDDVYSDIRTIAERLDVAARGDALVSSMVEAIAAESSSGNATDAGPRILVQWWPKPVIAPGRQSWVQGLLDRVGGVNPLADRDVKSTPLTDDEVLALAPDAFVISWCGVKPDRYRPSEVYRRAAWHELPAVRDRRVHCIPEAFLGRPGPRLVEGARALRQVVASLHAAS